MSIFKEFPRTFWVSNLVEFFERWAWYGMYMVLGLYLVSSPDTGALGFTQAQKGLIMGVVSFLVYFLPVFTGAIADRIGYKKTFIIAFILYITGFVSMTLVKSYILVFLTFGIVGIGAAFFKPVVSATIAKTTTEKNSAIGFGIFYMMVNIGAFIGPLFASKFRNLDWRYVFYMSAIIIGINLLLVYFFYVEPNREKITDDLATSVIKILDNIWEAIKDVKFLIFLLLIVSFWTMYNQLFYSLPIFVDYWVDTHRLYEWLYNLSPALANAIGNPTEKLIPAEILTDLDAFYIIIFQLIVSSLLKNVKPNKSILYGIIVATIGMSLVFSFRNPFLFFITIWIFSVGEMASSPRITEYIGRIAPDDKKGLYMGMSFLPVAGGNFLAGLVSGKPFEILADKYFLLKKALLEKGVNVPNFSNTFTKKDLWEQGLQYFNMTDKQLTDFLWNTYHPYKIWYIFAAIGLITIIGLAIYNKIVFKNQK